jgi:hypothetical protein
MKPTPIRTAHEAPAFMRGLLCAFTALMTAQITLADAPTVAPEPKALIEKSIESAGGREKLNAIKSMSIDGEISMPAQNINGTMQVYMKPDKASIVADLPGIGQIKSGINGDIAYEVSDIMGARLLSDDEKKQLLDGMNPDDQFDRYLDLKDAKVTGPEKVGESQAWKLTGKNESGDEESHWIDIKSYRALKSTMVMNHQMGKIPVQMSFSDYKEIDGIPFPSTITNTVGPATMVMKLKDVKINPEIDDAKFELPAEVKKLAERQKKKE